MHPIRLLSHLFLVLALLHWSNAYSPYSAYERHGPAGYSGGYTSSSYTSTSSSSSGSSSYGATHGQCCQLNSWALSHMAEVREFANRLRQEYNLLSNGGSSAYGRANSVPWRVNILELTGKAASDLDAECHRLGQELVSDMQLGVLSYKDISQSSFFDWQAAQLLEGLTQGAQDLGQTQTLEVSHFQPVDLSHFDEVKNYAYPAEVKVVDGKTYVVHKNCTEAVKTTYSAPTTYTKVVYGGPISGSLINSGSSTTYSGKKTLKDWIEENMEPSVTGYRPVVSVNGQSNNIGSLRQGFQSGYIPSTSSVVVRRVNKTIIRNSDGIENVHGSESEQKWVDGRLVYDNKRPFGASSVPRDEQWKREERERFFWFLTQGDATNQQLEAWQHQQEERLLSVAEHYHVSVEVIQDFHRKELERYKALRAQYNAQLNDAQSWQRIERARLDWLIHQNSLSREEFARWQRENQDRLAQLARQYRISLEELKRWQLNELDRLYVFFNGINNSMISRPAPNIVSGSQISGGTEIDYGTSNINIDNFNNEQERLNEIIRKHNETINKLTASINIDKQKIATIGQTYGNNVHELNQWLKEEIERVKNLISQQNLQMNNINEWQRSERLRLENILKQHQGSVNDLEAQMAHDRNYIQSLAKKYHVSIEELEKWQQTELARIQNEGQAQLDIKIKLLESRERDRLKKIIATNDLTVSEFQTQVLNDRKRLEELARTYELQVHEVEEWLKSEIQNFKSEGLLNDVKEELALWQKKERELLQSIVKGHDLTVEELEKKIINDHSHVMQLANHYQVKVDEIQDWLKKEILRLQSEGLVKADDLKEWQQHERDSILKLVQQNKLTIEEFERKLLSDRARLQDMAKIYNVKVSEIEEWIQKEGERLQNLGLLKIKEQLNDWQKIERERLLDLINKNNLSIGELEERLQKDQVHLYSLAHKNQVRVEEIEDWIKQEIKNLQSEGLLEMQKLKDWQQEWRGNLTNMVKERDFTVEQFHKWLQEDRARLQNLAMQHNVQIDEIETWVKGEEQRFVSMGLLKPNEKLTNWQQVERLHLERLAQQQYKSTAQLEERLRQDRELLEKLARDYSIQVEEIEKWMQKELARMRDEGQLQIDNLTAWQIAERTRLEKLVEENKQWSVDEFEAALRKDREHMQTMSFKYHVSIEEIEKWIQSEVERLKDQNKLQFQRLTAWQVAEHERILQLLEQQSGVTVEEFEVKIKEDRRFLLNLAQQYHVNVDEIEIYIKKVIEDLRKKGKLEIEKLQAWQLVERDYIKQLIAEYRNQLPTAEIEQKILSDRAHLHQLADQYRIDVEQIESWLVQELKRLRLNSEAQVKVLSDWQKAEVERLKQLIRQHNHLTYVDFEIELLKERERLEELAKQYSLSVTQVEEWLRQQLLNLKTTGEAKVENLTQWQNSEQQRLIELLLKHHNDISYPEFERQLKSDRNRLQSLSQKHHVSVEQIEQWMRDELQRLQNSGLMQVEQLNYWQRDTRNHLEDWLKQQHNDASFQEFTEFLKRDRARIESIARQYHVTVQEVEEWVKKEGARLQLIGVVQRPESAEWVHTYENIWSEQVPQTVSSNDELWKQQTFGHLQAESQIKPMTQQDVEVYLENNRERWEQFARSYDITVEEIESWLRQSAKGITLQEWQIEEQRYIQDLLNQQLRKQQKWSIEELERQLLSDQRHMKALANKYHTTSEELELWYQKELQRLLNERRIISENLLDWQRREKQHIYDLVKPQRGVSVHVIEEQLLHDRNALKQRAREYTVTVEELKLFLNNELKRLTNLGLIGGGVNAAQTSNRWQEEERQRLRQISTDITITEEELLEFISTDKHYQQMLAKLYGVGLHELAPFQRIVISQLAQEGVYDNTVLKFLQPWQIRERDRLYELIKNQHFNLRNLRDWQRQDSFYNELAAKYGVSVHELKAWQLREFERLMRLADYYKLTLNKLQDFRDKEIRYITYIMHKKTSTDHERANWESNEFTRNQQLEAQTGLRSKQLLDWRRRLYLLSQGRLELDVGGPGGQLVGQGSTGSTAGAPKQVISKDRGDQPPNVYEENIGEEPGLEGETAPPTVPTHEHLVTPSQSAAYLPPALPAGNVQSGMSYSKKQYKFTIPTGTATASASSDVSSSSAAAGIGHAFNGMQPHSQIKAEEADYGQQQQQEETDDFGQQQQVELGWNGKLQAADADLGQQQVQVEDLGGYGTGGYAHSSYTSSSGQQQQQEQLQDYGQQQQVQVEDLNGSYGSSGAQQRQQQVQSGPTQEPVEVKAVQEPSSIWGKFKKKTSDIFG